MKDNTSAGRSFIMWQRFHKADFNSVDSTAVNYTIHFHAVTERNEHTTSSWNPATLDLGTYMAETIGLLSLGLIIILRRKEVLPMASI